MRWRWVFLVVVVSCGGKSVVGGGGGGGGAPSGSGGGAAGGGGNGASCTAHDDCGELELCVFADCTCALACDAMIPMFCAEKNCVTCGTSSCPGCEDCRAVCLSPP